jgi:hypothetical protein
VHLPTRENRLENRIDASDKDQNALGFKWALILRSSLHQKFFLIKRKGVGFAELGVCNTAVTEEWQGVIAPCQGS